MSENDENSFPWQRHLSYSNAMFAAVINAGIGLPAGGKTAKIGRVAYFLGKSEPEEF